MRSVPITRTRPLVSGDLALVLPGTRRRACSLHVCCVSDDCCVFEAFIFRTHVHCYHLKLLPELLNCHAGVIARCRLTEHDYLPSPRACSASQSSHLFNQCPLIHLGHQKAKKANTVFGLGLTDCFCRSTNLELANGSASPFSTLDKLTCTGRSYMSI